jgi:hypothetical protein
MSTPDQVIPPPAVPEYVQETAPALTIVKPAPVPPEEPPLPQPVAAEVPARIGVLFVHGMGDQKRGSTLQKFGDPIIQWIRRWESRDFDPERLAVLEPEPVANEMGGTARTSGDDVSINPTSSPLGYTVIRGETADPSCYEPPTTEFTMAKESADTGQQMQVTWVLAEAWWADTFFPPKFSDVAKWGLGVGPRFVVRHFELSTSGLPAWPQALRYAVALMLVLLFEMVMMLLLVLATLPFARNYVRSMILKLIGSFGDPMVLVASPLTSASISTAVSNAIRWLRDTKQCQHIAVVAHSLGTVVSYNVLSSDSERISLFVTFGAAIKKAQILQKVQQNDIRLSLGIVLAAGAFTSFVFVALVSVLYWSEIPEDLKSTSDWRHYAGWLWLYLLMISGLMLCVARLALWRRKGPRYMAPFGCAIAAVAGILLLASRPTATNPVSISDLGFGMVWDVFASDDFLRVIPLVLGGILVTIREWRDADRYREALPESYRQIEAESHPPQLGSPLIQFLLLAGVYLVCIDRWTPPQMIAPLLVTGLVLCYSAIRVPFGNGYIAGDGEREDIVPFPFANDSGGTTLKWRDFWATADPVPDGGFSPGNVGQSPRTIDLVSIPTTNQKSIATDHTTYEENLEQFVGPLVSELMELSGWHGPFAEPENSQVAELSRTRRTDRVSALPRSTTILVASALAIIGYLYFNDLPTLSELGNKALAPLMGVLKLVLDDGWVEKINHFLSGALFGALLIGLLAVLWYRVVVFQAWRQWDKADQNAMFRRYPSTMERHSAPVGKLPGTVDIRRWAFALVGYVVPVALAITAVLFGQFDISWWPHS